MRAAQRGTEVSHSSPVDFQKGLENPQGRAYTDNVNSVMYTMST